MTEPIPVSLAIRAVERAIRECDAATPGPWDTAIDIVRVDVVGAKSVQEDRANEAFVALARAGFRATLEYLRHRVGLCNNYIDTTDMTAPLHAAVAPLIAHYDATAPGWRTE